MASNQVLIDEINADCKALGITVNAAGLTNAALVALLSDLKAQKKSAHDSNSTDDNGANTQERKVSESQCTVNESGLAFTYNIVKGKAITSKRGVLSDGDLVKPEYFAGGQDTLDDLYQRGFIEKVNK